ncbi:MAG: NifB/NifX family molybdenum-iron cluster-binding protein, partial [Dehalococcoidia bacterium]|nr:NifB/NifX family molybdenum-iron cluster-binding protein [Dehalococcoidia bacterium]
MEAGAEQLGRMAQCGPEAANPVVRVAVASRDRIMVNLHFGHAQEFLIFEASAGGSAVVDVRRAPQYCHGEDSCCEGEVLLPQIFELLSDCQYLLASRVGRTPGEYLGQRGIRCLET